MSMEKIANNQELTKLDIITAAQELAEFEKQAADADAAGREAAHEVVDEMAKAAAAEDQEIVEAAAAAAADEIMDEEEDESVETEKKSSVNAGTEISAAVEVLKRHGVIK